MTTQIFDPDLLDGTAGDGVLVNSNVGTVSTVNSTTITLGSNGNFTGTWELVTDYAAISIILISDKNSATNGFRIEFSTDGTNVDHFDQITYTAASGGYPLESPTHAKYFRINYTNTNSAQTYFRLQTTYYTVNPGKHSGRIDGVITGATHGQIVKSVITGETTAGGGGFVNVKVNPSGSLATAPGSPTAPVTGSGTLGSLNADVIFDNSAGYSSISYVLTDTSSGTITPAVSVDGTNYLSWESADRATFYTSHTSTSSFSGSFTADIANWRYFRLRMTSYTSGTASVSYFATANPSVNKRVILNTQTLSSAGATQRSQVVGIDTEHDKVHLGLLFSWDYTDSQNANGYTRVAMTTGAQTQHSVFMVISEFQCEFTIYEGSTTTKGATLTEYNHNTGSANTSLNTIQVVTAVTATGTAKQGPLRFGSSGGSSSTVILPRNNEWMFKANTEFLIEVKSLVNNNDITIVCWNYRNQA